MVNRRIDDLISSKGQYICGALIGGIGYLIAGSSQGDSVTSVALQAGAGILVGLAVVAAIRRLGRSGSRERD